VTSLNEAQYAELCAVCDALLLAPDATIERIAMPWLHVLNEHPSNLAKYSGLVSPGRGITLHRLRSAASQARRWLDTRKRGADADQLPSSADVIFVSHLLNESQIGARQDFYFGRLPELLLDDGISSCVLLINHIPTSRRLHAAWPSDMASRVILPDSLSLRGELSLRRRLGRDARRLRKASLQLEGGRRRIVNEAARNATSGHSLASLRMYQQIRDITARLRPRAVVVTYEGHAWERVAFAAARQSNHAVRCLGYHHTILFPRQHAALRLLNDQLYDPDVILTAGEISAARFHRSFGGAAVDVATMGIHRRESVAPSTEAPESSDRSSRCLIIPDGVISEVIFLLDFAVEAARQAPDIRFVLRLHPVVSLEQLKTRFQRFQRLPANVEFSTISLSADFARSRWAVYRATNAAIYAVIAGLRPFYVEKPGEMSIDSLYELKGWKKVVRTPAEFVESARSDAGPRSPFEAAEATVAADYCKRYFVPPDYRVFVNALGRG